jgi:hypothetical protein
LERPQRGQPLKDIYFCIFNDCFYLWYV